MSCYESWSILIQASAAIATFIAICIAIWGDHFRYRIGMLKPKLRIELLLKSGELNTHSNGPVRYYHLRVFNDHSFAMARNASVEIKEVFSPDSSGNFKPKKISGTFPLVWRYGIQPRTIGKHNPQSCDLGVLDKNRNRFDIQTTIKPSNIDLFLDKNNPKIKLTIVCFAEGVCSNELNLEIYWDGQWSDDSTEISNHLVFKSK
jgi:hypothetical protein